MQIVLQQEKVLAELESHANPDIGDPPEEAGEVMATHRYLRACNHLFEQGFLSHQKIQDMESEVIQNITKGFEFFKSWCNQLSDTCEYTDYMEHYTSSISYAIVVAGGGGVPLCMWYLLLLYFVTVKTCC